MTSKTKARLIAQANSIGTNGATTAPSSSTTTNTTPSIASTSTSTTSSSRRRRRHARDEPSNTNSNSNSNNNSVTQSSSSRRRGSGSGGSSRSSHSRSSHDDSGDVAVNDVDANAARLDDEEPVFQSQLYALEEFERAFVSERAALGLAPTSANSAGGDSGSSSRSHRRRHQRLGSSSPPQPRRRRSSPSSVLLTTAGVPLLDALLENIVVMKSGRWDCIELISAPAFGEVVRVEDQGILLIAPTRTHMHIPSRPTDAKLCVLNHLLETLQYPHTAEFDDAKSTIVLINAENGVRADLRTPIIVPTPLYLRSERATRGIITAMPGEIVVSPSGRTSAKTTTTATSAATAAAADAESADAAADAATVPAAPAVVGGEGGLIQRKSKLSRVQWRLSRNIALEFRPDQEH